MSILWKTFLPMNRLPGSAGILPASLQKGPTPAGRDAGAPRFMVAIYVHFWKTLLAMNRSISRFEDHLKDSIAALSSFVHCLVSLRFG